MEEVTRANETLARLLQKFGEAERPHVSHARAQSFNDALEKGIAHLAPEVDSVILDVDYVERPPARSLTAREIVRDHHASIGKDSFLLITHLPFPRQKKPYGSCIEARGATEETPGVICVETEPGSGIYAPFSPEEIREIKFFKTGSKHLAARVREWSIGYVSANSVRSPERYFAEYKGFQPTKGILPFEDPAGLKEVYGRILVPPEVSTSNAWGFGRDDRISGYAFLNPTDYFDQPDDQLFQFNNAVIPMSLRDRAPHVQLAGAVRRTLNGSTSRVEIYKGDDIIHRLKEK